MLQLYIEHQAAETEPTLEKDLSSFSTSARINMLFLKAVVAFLLQIATLVHAADTAAWKSRSIYFVLTDRIARSSSDTGGASCSNLGKYCGGTFEGLESKLDYIKNLGFDAIWITPIVASSYCATVHCSGSC